MPAAKKSAAKKKRITQEAEKARAAMEPQVTSASEWGRKKHVEGFVVALPSGEVARVRRTLDLPHLLRTGRIPNPLAGILRKSISAKGLELNSEEMDEQTLFQFMDLLDQTVAAMMVEPRAEIPYVAQDDSEEERQKVLEWAPSEGAISVHQVEQEDKMYLFAIAQGAVLDLSKFREEQERQLAALQEGEEIQPTSVADGGD